eukprot:6343638-Amphidinium_carterae.1
MLSRKASDPKGVQRLDCTLHEARDGRVYGGPRQDCADHRSQSAGYPEIRTKSRSPHVKEHNNVHHATLLFKQLVRSVCDALCSSFESHQMPSWFRQMSSKQRCVECCTVSS